MRLFRYALRCRKTGACRILVPLRYCSSLIKLPLAKQTEIAQNVELQDWILEKWDLWWPYFFKMPELWCHAVCLQCACSVPAVFLRCSCSVPAVFLQCSCSVPAVFLQCSCSVPMFLWYSCSVPAVFLRCSCSVPAVFLRCSCGVPAVILRCACSVPVVFLQCSCGVPAVFLQCSCSVPAVLLQCSCGVPAVFLRCSCSVPAVFLRCSCCVPAVFLWQTIRQGTPCCMNALINLDMATWSWCFISAGWWLEFNFTSSAAKQKKNHIALTKHVNHIPYAPAL